MPDACGVVPDFPNAARNVSAAASATPASYVTPAAAKQNSAAGLEAVAAAEPKGAAQLCNKLRRRRRRQSQTNVLTTDKNGIAENAQVKATWTTSEEAHLRQHRQPLSSNCKFLTTLNPKTQPASDGAAGLEAAATAEPKGAAQLEARYFT